MVKSYKHALVWLCFELTAFPRIFSNAPSSVAHYLQTFTCMGLDMGELEKKADEKFCPDCGTVIKVKAEICPSCGVRQSQSFSKSRITAALLALFFGGIGVHKFYLGKSTQGIIYLLFCWTFVPSFFALIDFIVLLCSQDDAFYNKYAVQIQ